MSMLWFLVSGAFVLVVYLTSRLIADVVVDRRARRRLRWALRQQLRYQAWAEVYRSGGE